MIRQKWFGQGILAMANEAGPIGLIGLGLIGTALAQRLLACGFTVHGFDIAPERCEALRSLGGNVAGSAHDVGRACRCVVLAVFDTRQVASVLEDTDGLEPRPGHLIVCTSTCDPDATAELNERLVARGVRFLEVPLSGNSHQIALGNGVAMVGGERAAMDAAAPVLAAISKQQFHVGPVGSGGRAKLAVNLVGGLNRAVLAEGLALAESMGLDIAAFLDLLKASAAYSRAMDTRGTKMVESDFTPHAWLKQSLKDFQLMKMAAERVGQELPLARVYTELIESCIAHGEGELDNSAVIQELRRRRSARPLQ
jgi:3-hydroxyisobutyrate dehydrogenase-like beta-hydroxyacid dehydrogenase